MTDLGPTLYVMATPIGNLQDATERLKETLSGVDILAAEDTRRARTLLARFDITPSKLIRCDENKEEIVKDTLIKHLQEGRSVGLISDAGTPCISDPGWRVVCAAHENNIPVIPIVGPSAISGALSVCGFPATPYTFYGFVDKKKTRAEKTLEQMLASKHTSVFFESPYRIEKTLGQLLDLEPTRHIFMIREMTKKFEQSFFGSVQDVQKSLATTKGEWTVVISPNHDRFRS